MPPAGKSPDIETPRNGEEMMHLFKRTAKVLLTGFCLVYWMAQSTSASTLTYLYNFSGVSPDGAGPLAGVIFGQSGELYGTTNAGGITGYGTVFKLARPTTTGLPGSPNCPDSERRQKNAARELS
jgi:hypothetical protein